MGWCTTAAKGRTTDPEPEPSWMTAAARKTEPRAPELNTNGTTAARNTSAAARKTWREELKMNTDETPVVCEPREPPPPEVCF